MNNVPNTASQCVRSIARKIYAATTRSQLVALFVLLGMVAAVTFATTGYAERLANKLSPAAMQQGARLRPAKPTLTTDKGTYLAGEPIVLSGTNWAPGESVTIILTADSIKGGESTQVEADKSGSFTASMIMPAAASASEEAKERKGAIRRDESEESGGTFTATAVGSSSRYSVQTRFVMGIADRDGERLLANESYWMDRLSYPANRFDPAWVSRAAEQDSRIERRIPMGQKQSIKSLAANPLALSPIGFTALGPQPERMTGCAGCFDYGITQGRVNAIAIDPTTTTPGSIVAYIATVGGGVWKTTTCCTGTTSWTATTDDAVVSTTSVDSVVVDPNNHNTIYAGTGDLNYGSFSMGSQGVLKSTDAGATWTVLGGSIFGAALPVGPGQFPQYQAIGKVRVDPNNSTRVAVATKTGIYISYDSGTNWTGPCVTNALSTQRQDITGLELTNMGGGVTRILAAVGVRGFATTVQYNLDQNGANGLYKGTMPASGCPSDFTLITTNANGFVFGTAVSGSPYATGALMNAGSGIPYGGNTTTGTQNGRMDIAVAPSNPNTIYIQVGSIVANNNSGCGNAAGCQIGVWASTDGGATWAFMTGSAGGSLRQCGSTGTQGVTSGAAGGGDYPQNWYDQGMAVDPNNPDRVFVDTYDTWLAIRGNTTFYNVTCGYNGNPVANHVVHVDHHALAFVPGSSSILLEGSDGGIFSTSNANVAAENTARPTWVNMDTGINTVEFYAGDISGNFATAAAPMVVAGAQDNGPSSVTFSGSPTGPIQWQMGLGGDGFSGQIDPMGTGPTQASGTITLTTGGAVAGEQFVIGSQTFTFQVAARTGAGQVTLNSSTTTEGNNIVTAVNADLAGIVTSARNGATVVVTAVAPGAGGNSIVFTEGATNMTMNGSGTLGGTTQGGLPGSLRVWEGNNSGGLSRCTVNCSNSGASWSSRQGGWTSDQQSFVLPINMFHGGIAGGDDCEAAGPTTGCGHLIAGTTRVFETISGATGTNTWYITNNPAGSAAGPNLTKGTLGNRSFINQVKYSPKFQSVAIVGTNDGNVQIGFNLGTGVASQANWVNVTGANAVLPNRPILGIALDPSVPAANVPVGYAAVGGFNENTPTTPGHVFKVTCTANCASSIMEDKSGNLPNIPVDSIIANPNIPNQVFAGTDFGLFYTDDISVATPVWYRFNIGLPNVMIWDMAVDRGSTTLALFTRSRGAFAWPLPLAPLNPPTVTAASATGTYGGTAALSATMLSGGNPVPGKTIAFTLNGNSAGSAITNGSGVATIPAASLAGINANTYPTGVGATFAGDINYATASDTDSLTVNPANQTITVNTHAPASAVHGSQFVVAATSDSGLPVAYSSSGSCTNVGATFTMTSGTGTCSVMYNQAGNGNFNPAPQVLENTTAQECGSPTNVALASYGATAVASSSANANFLAGGAIDGEHNGNTWGSNGGWNDRTRAAFPDDIQVNLNVMQTFGEIDVYTLKNDFNSGSVVTDTTTFSSYGITNFNVQYWTGSVWADVPGGAVTGNNLVKRKFVFPDITTDRVRVLVNDSADHLYSRVVEIEVLACNAAPVPTPTPTPTPAPTPCASPSNNVALATAGSMAVASSSANASFLAGGAIDGEHNGNTWGSNGGWNDRTRGVFPDNIQVNFVANQTIREIDVYTLKDDFNSGSIVNDATTFSSYGITNFNVQYWTGTAWADVPGGAVTGNNLVKRKFIFSDLTTDKIRVVVNDSADHLYSRVVEIEAFACSPAPFACVNPGGTGGCFASIQAAHDAVTTTPGTNILVYPGTYTENVTITKSVRLLGAQHGVDARGRSAPESSVSPATAANPTFLLNASMTTAAVDGFTLTGGTSLGVIQTQSGSDFSNLLIANNRFSGYSQSAVFLNRGGANITIDHNVMDGSSIAGSGQAIFGNGPQSFAGLFVTNNNIINNTGRYGVFIDGNHNVGESATRAPSISGNLFDNNLQGLNLGSRSFGTLAAPVTGPFGGYINNNMFSNHAANGIQGGLQHVQLNGNTFSNNAISGLALTSFGNAGADRGGQNSSITCNRFTGNLSEGMFFSASQGAGLIGTNVFNNNNLVGNFVGVTYNGTETINGTNNWWNSATGPTIASNPGGTGDKITNASGGFTYAPFLSAAAPCAP